MKKFKAMEENMKSKMAKAQGVHAFTRRAFLGGVLAISAGLCGCGAKTLTSGDAQGSQTSGAPEAKPQEEAPKVSSDPHVVYIKNYKGQNAAALGYAAANTFRMEKLGAIYLRLVYVDPSGVFVDPEDEEQLKGYVVFDQNLAPNTQVDIEFRQDKEGNELQTIARWQSHEQVVLAVKATGSPDPTPVDMTAIDGAPDRYTNYIRDYTGRNLAECGYNSAAGNLTDAYGPGFIHLATVSYDGAYIDPADKEALASYVVVSQDVAPNTQFTMEPTTAANGEVYDLIGSQSIDTVTLTVRKLEAKG